MDPLLCALESTLMGIRASSNFHKSEVIACEEDVTLLLTSASECTQNTSHAERKSESSGVKINIEKSKAMAVGMWDITVNIMGIMYHGNMKILGIHFTSTTSQSALKSWSVVEDGLRAQAREPCYRQLSLNKRIHFVHTYMLSRTWFTAQVFPMSPTCERQINTAITWSLWRGGIFRAPLSTLERRKLHGGWDLMNGNFRHRAVSRPRSNGYRLTLSTCSISRYMDKQLLAAKSSGPPAWELGEVLPTPPR